MNKSKQQTNWMIDALLFSALLVSFLLDVTGVVMHQWLGVVVAVIAGYHLWTHLDWVTAVTDRFFGRTSNQARIYYLVDAGLYLGLLLIFTTGLVISTWLGLSLSDPSFWIDLHVTISILTLTLVVFKIGIHWRWVITTGRRYIFNPGLTATRKSVPALAYAGTDRRDFLKLMGVVGAAAILASVSALKDDDQALAEGTSLDSTLSSQTQLQIDQGLSQSSASSACVSQCPRGCSYPGHCRRYVDSNQNGRCDLGECV